MKIDLADCTFMIPYKYDHPDRAENLELCRDYLTKHFDTNTIVQEQTGLFHRTKMINKMAVKAKTPIIINYDCDVFIDPLQINVAVNMVRRGYDMVFPYDGRFARVPREWYPKLKRTLDVSIFGNKQFIGMGAQSQPKVGGCIVHNKRTFMEAGGENEKFISWGHEDRERYHRFKTLGYKVDRVAGVLYHLDHHMSIDSSPENPYYCDNAKEYKAVKNMNKEQLKQYVWQISSLAELSSTQQV